MTPTLFQLLNHFTSGATDELSSASFGAQVVFSKFFKGALGRKTRGRLGTLPWWSQVRCRQPMKHGWEIPGGSWRLWVVYNRNIIYPLVNIQKTIENCPFSSLFVPLKMVIFHSYVSLPGGMIFHCHVWLQEANGLMVYSDLSPQIQLRGLGWSLNRALSTS